MVWVVDFADAPAVLPAVDGLAHAGELFEAGDHDEGRSGAEGSVGELF